MQGSEETGVQNMSGVTVEHKVWLKKGGAVFGDGLFNLLSNIEGTGSIAQAARLMNMSYRAAWGKIKMAEERFGMQLVVTQVGGEAGGGARLTPEAKKFLKKFRLLKEEIEEILSKKFREIFGD